MTVSSPPSGSAKSRPPSTTYVYTPDDNVIEGEIESGKRYKEADFNNHRDQENASATA